MSSSCSQNFRKVLNASWCRKGFLFWIFLPILLVLWVFWSVVSFYRRTRGYAEDFIPDNMKLCCVGNVLMGGSGKSPIVRALAKKYIEKDRVVVIMARGIGSNLLTGFVSSPAFDNLFFELPLAKLQPSALSDENREHFELVRMSFPDAAIAIFQGPSRRRHIQIVADAASKVREASIRVVLDDGLQHFAAPRDCNACVWDPKVVALAPALCFPFGPYREDSFARLHSMFEKFDVNMWSRSMGNNMESFRDSVKNSLMRFGKVPSESKDVLVEGRHAFFFADFYEQKWKFERVVVQRARERFESSALCFVTGIAGGAKFVEEIHEMVSHKLIAPHLELSDHGEFTQTAVRFIANFRVVAVTAKDYFRWCDLALFRAAVAGKLLIVVTVEVSCYFWGNSENRMQWPKDEVL